MACKHCPSCGFSLGSLYLKKEEEEPKDALDAIVEKIANRNPRKKKVIEEPVEEEKKPVKKRAPRKKKVVEEDVETETYDMPKKDEYQPLF